MIKGLTDQKRRKSIYSAILHKGERKPPTGYGFGKDLNNLFRLELKDPLLKGILEEMGIKKMGSSSDPLDFVTDSLTVFLASENIEEAFVTSMQLWDATGLVQECDREKIYHKRVLYADQYNQERSRMEPCNAPCPMDKPGVGVQIPCVKGCQKSGTLLFHIPQFIDNGCNKPCKLHVQSYEDFNSILNDLEKIQEEFGSIFKSPGDFPCARGVIPLVLKRVKVGVKKPTFEAKKDPKGNPLRDGKGKTIYEMVTIAGREVPKRTSKKADGVMWAVTIEVDPTWVKNYYRWEEIKKVKSLGYAPNPKLLKGLDVIDVPSVEVIDPTILPAAEVPVLPEATLGEGEFKQIQKFLYSPTVMPLWGKNEKEARENFFKVLLSTFEVAKPTDISLSKYEAVQELLFTGKVEF